MKIFPFVTLHCTGLMNNFVRAEGNFNVGSKFRLCNAKNRFDSNGSVGCGVFKRGEGYKIGMIDSRLKRNKSIGN